MSDTPKPIHTIRLGTVQAAIWSNAGQHGPFYNVTVRDHTGRSEDAPLRPADLPVVRALTTQAEDWLRHQPQPEPRLAPLNPAFNRVRDSR